MNASFDGVTGKVNIDENGDREGLPGYDVVNYQSSNSFHTVGDWNVENGLSLRGSGGIIGRATCHGTTILEILILFKQLLKS